MKVSRRWLEAFLRRSIVTRDLAEQLANLGAPADAITPLHGELAGIVVALVEEIRPHPNADRLRLCLVNDGTAERCHVVCGANNVVAGTKYPFARVGSTLPGGLTIEKRKIRGEPSEGMLCSADELKLGSDHDGLLTLSTEAPPGSPFLAVLGLDDDMLELDISPVRPDLLGHKGIARELATAYKTTFRLPELPPRAESLRGDATAEAIPALGSIRPTTALQGTTAGATITIGADSSCARFTAAVIRGVAVGPSPDWLRARLEATGHRSINNVVDATNYTMLELGQPLHAYDLAQVQGPALTARLAQPGEKVVTLDGVSRSLSSSITIIADSRGPVGVGGVMGGQGSEVGPDTTDILLECAWFAPGPTRAGRKELGLVTDASQRFERGTDLWAVPDALRRCLEVILNVAGGRVDGEPLDLWPEPKHPPRIFLRTARVAQVLGLSLPIHVLEQALVAIGATVVAKPVEERLAVEVPGWRPDLTEEIDLIEEIARIHGFAGFPDGLRPFRAGNQTDAPMTVALAGVRRGLVAEGLFEVALLPIGPADDEGVVPILNPLSAEHGFLRSRLFPGLLRQVESNWSSQVRDVRLFEVGTVFKAAGPGQRPVETTRAAAVLTGARHPAHWTDAGRTPDVDSWDLKGLFERAVSLANPRASVQVERDGWTARLPDGTEVGTAGQLQADAPPWAGALFGFEVEVDPVARAAERYQPLPTTPAVTRDIALLLPDGVVVEAVAAAVRGIAGTILERLSVVDEYRGKGLPPGRRSVVLRLVLRGKERTLRDSDAEAVIARVLNKLEQTLDVTLRTA